jgi:hypothetical protein
LTNGVAYWGIGAVCFLLSTTVSLLFLSRNTDILEKVKQLLQRRRNG